MAVAKSRSGVIDARSSLQVHITKRDIAAGSLKNAKSCAAAKAICRQTKCEAAHVYIGRTYVKQNGKWIRYATPASLRNEIIAFDRGGEFAPGNFTLTPVQPVLQFKNRRAREEYMKEYNKRPDRNRAAGRTLHVVKGIREKARLPRD